MTPPAIGATLDFEREAPMSAVATIVLTALAAIVPVAFVLASACEGEYRR